MRQLSAPRVELRGMNALPAVARRARYGNTSGRLLAPARECWMYPPRRVEHRAVVFE